MYSKLYSLKNTFLQYNEFLNSFVGIQLRETEKAVYLYGHGTAESVKTGICCKCGRTLTHPVSVELGIGPECGKHYHDWDKIGGYTIENLERLKGSLVEIIVEGWVPKSCVMSQVDSQEIVVLPETHKFYEEMQVKRTGVSTKPSKYTEVIEGKGKYDLQMIKIVFPFDMDLITKIKSLENRAYIPDKKYWVCSITIPSIKRLKEWGFVIDPQLESLLTLQDDIKNSKNPEIVYHPKVVIPGLKGVLFPFQNVGVSFIESKRGRALIADEMGLGKTVQALAWLQLHPELRPAIVIVPASLKLNWKREAEQWMVLPNTEILSGTKPGKITGEIVIINYDILTNWIPILKSLQAKVLILDEIHSIKNSGAKRTKATKIIAKGITHVIGLSGTPVVNRPIEIYNALTIINSSVIPNFKVYTQKFCDAKHNGFGWDFSGASNTEELHQLLVNSFMIRRKKADVLKDLPAKRTSFVPIEIDNKEEYYAAENDFIKFVRDTRGNAAALKAEQAETLTRINLLKQLCIKGKLAGIIDWVEEFLESGKKLVLFATHRNTIDVLMEKFEGIAVRYDGAVNMSDRQKAVDAFQNNENIKLFIGMIDTEGKPAGVGITLTAASDTATLEYQWGPGIHDQADDRVHRIGQQEAVVNYKLMSADTIEEKIAHLLDSKRKVIDSVMDGITTLQSDLLEELINSYL